MGWVAEGWIVTLSTATKQKPLLDIQISYLGIMADNELWRIQASVSVNDEKALRFASWLGFEDEGLMKKYGPDGSDHRRVARFA